MCAVAPVIKLAEAIGDIFVVISVVDRIVMLDKLSSLESVNVYHNFIEYQPFEIKLVDRVMNIVSYFGILRTSTTTFIFISWDVSSNGHKGRQTIPSYCNLTLII